MWTPVDRDRLSASYRAHVAHLRTAYAAALEESGHAAVVLHSGSLRPRSTFDDQFWALRIMPHFAHWVPLEWADCALVVTAAARPRLVAYRDPSFWERAPEPHWAHFREELDIVEVGSAEAVKGEIGPGRVAIISEDPVRAASWGFDESQRNPPGLVAALDALRTRKTPYEVACLAEANRRAARGHRAVAEAFRAGHPSELDLHLLFLSATSQDDSETPYKDIVALGPNSAILHHIHYQREGRRGPRSLLLDAGAGCLGYGSDVTRAYVTGAGEAAAAFGELIQRVDAMQQSLCAQVRLGMPYESLHDQAHREVAAILREMGIARLSDDELVGRGVTRKFLPHGLGHSLGIQTHDVGCLVKPPRPENPWLRNTTDVAVDQVFTIEPGIYFNDSLLAELEADPAGRSIDWALVNSLRPFGGVRIEDDVVVVDPARGGLTVRNLTREAFWEGADGLRVAERA
jgi:Xaa-Pro dipeptidase